MIDRSQPTISTLKRARCGAKTQARTPARSRPRTNGGNAATTTADSGHTGDGGSVNASGETWISASRNQNRGAEFDDGTRRPSTRSEARDQRKVHRPWSRLEGNGEHLDAKSKPTGARRRGSPTKYAKRSTSKTPATRRRRRGRRCTRNADDRFPSSRERRNTDTHAVHAPSRDTRVMNNAPRRRR